MEKNNLIIIILIAICLILGTALATYVIVENQHADAKIGNNTNNTNNTTTAVKTEKVNEETQKSVYAYKSDGTPMYSQAEVDNYVKSKYGAVNYHIQDNGYINIDDPGYTDDGAKVVRGGVNKDGKIYERSYYENNIMGK
ncbi:hypothetical protein [Methanobrevibacter sp.]|uniref:hypothetical protein n=1 Tax=Methanobrevibacter sp. TaxID=66852 RepID=UPI00388D7EC7